MSLTDFLLARITEDEAQARAAIQEYETCPPSVYEVAQVPMLDAGDPVRVLAECESKRRIVGELDLRTCGPCARAERCVNHDASASGTGRERLFDWTSERILWHLALPYADHPDYREEWRV